MLSSSLVDYYRKKRFNPVPISLRNTAEWKAHVAKRRNLYEKHLGIPLFLLRGRHVIEFGCNSGENALVPASMGARLTLVEPNRQVFLRLRSLFKKFNLEKQIIKLANCDIEGFRPSFQYDVVIAEGFINTLADRERSLRKLCDITTRDGIVIISFDDRYGHWLEMTRKLLFWRTCQLKHIYDMHGDASLAIARRLFGKDFARLNVSRPFESWWKDVLLNPFVDHAYFWTLEDVLSIFEKAGFEFYSCSPEWHSADRFSWYKNVHAGKEIHRCLAEDWKSVFFFFLTGLPPLSSVLKPAPGNVINAVSTLVKNMSRVARPGGAPIRSVYYPRALERYFDTSGDMRLVRLNREMKHLYSALRLSDPGKVIKAYHEATSLRNMWGMGSPYFCFRKV